MKANGRKVLAGALALAVCSSLTAGVLAQEEQPKVKLQQEGMETVTCTIAAFGDEGETADSPVMFRLPESGEVLVLTVDEAGNVKDADGNILGNAKELAGGTSKLITQQRSAAPGGSPAEGAEDTAAVVTASVAMDEAGNILDEAGNIVGSMNGVKKMAALEGEAGLPEVQAVRGDEDGNILDADGTVVGHVDTILPAPGEPGAMPANNAVYYTMTGK